MAAPNYAFAKKQRELAQKKKKEEKLRKKTGRSESSDDKARDDADTPQPSSPQTD